MIILDLEWNRGYDGPALDEILQIGAVRVDKLGGPIVDTYNVYIQPVLHKSFDLGAKKLPDLALSLASQVDFPQAMEGFRAWCGEERTFGGWGGGDLKTLGRCCEYYGVRPMEVEEELDLQGAFCRAVGAEYAQMALWKAVCYCGIPEVFCYHNALNDAMYTSCLCQWIRQEDLRGEPEREKRPRTRFSAIPYGPTPRRRIGPLPSVTAVLDSKDGRLPACPVCGRRGWVADWYTADGERYFSSFHCREHGNFLCRLTLSRTVDGGWQGRLAVPVLSPEARADYDRAMSATAHHCRSLCHRRARRGDEKRTAVTV